MTDASKNEPLLRMRNVSVSLKNRQEPLVKNINLEIFPGETLALVGDSGAGKSLTAYSIPALLPEEMAVEGSILFNGKNICNLKKQQIRTIRGQHIGMIFQEPMSSLNPLHKVGAQISEVLIQHQGLDKNSARQRVIQLLKDVELSECLINRLPHQLSGGQRQRVVIAMAIANSPKLLIADEPTTALDVTVEQQILLLIKRLQKKFQMAVLFITHDLGLVRHYSDRIGVMSGGNIVEQGPCIEIFTYPQHHVTRRLIESVPSGQPHPPEDNHQLTLQAKELKAWYRTKRHWFGRSQPSQPVISNISFSLKPGETLGLVGESGSGKTSLGLSLLRMLISSGEIFLQEQAVHNLREKQFRFLRKKIQLVFQDPFGSLNPRMTIKEILEEGLKLHSSLSSDVRLTKMLQTLRDVDLSEDSLERYPHEFSGGQRQRIALARAITLKPALLILDEPTSSLDRTLQLQLIELLRKIQQKYRTSYLFISHDLRVVKAMSHRIAVMRYGRIIESGPAEFILTRPRSDYTRALVHAAFHKPLSGT